MNLSEQQFCFFHNHGFLHLPAALSPADYGTALAHAESRVSADAMQALQADRICSLFNDGPIANVVTALMSEGQIQPISEVQLIHQPAHSHDDKHLQGAGSLDCLSAASTSSRGYERQSTCLGLILLTDILQPYMGNFTVVPGSHRVAANYFRENGHGVLRNGMPKLSFSQPPLQITGRAGDVILCHHLLSYQIAPNCSAQTSTSLLGRYTHRSVPVAGLEAFSQPWQEWEGIRAQLANI